jgi:NAD(P)-dependent dehydrogenase (short-subunit alcohol dehydrogenase family)
VDPAGKTAVVTGAASGIGRALAEHLARAGARVVVSDIDAEGAERVADRIERDRRSGDGRSGVGRCAIALPCDVASAADVDALVGAAEAVFGPVDLFCANAGVAGGYDLDTPDEGWDLAMAVNVRAHVYAARRLVPAWIERGGGYFLSTASAAGLLTAIGSAPYTVSKHAAVGFAEWLSITYGDRGVKVSCLCPMGVDTPLLSEGLAQRGPARLGSQVIVSTSTVLQPEQVAEAAIEGLRAERFLILPHPEAYEYELGRVADRDAWLATMRRLQAHHLRELESVA